jgi:hypothetical protein
MPFGERQTWRGVEPSKRRFGLLAIVRSEGFEIVPQFSPRLCAPKKHRFDGGAWRLCVGVDERSRRPELGRARTHKPGSVFAAGMSASLRNVVYCGLVLELILEFCQQARGQAGPFQMEANLVERVIGRAGLRAPVHAAHDSIIGIPQQEFCVDLGMLDAN